VRTALARPYLRGRHLSKCPLSTRPGHSSAIRRMAGIHPSQPFAAAPMNDCFSIAAFVKSNLTSFRFFSRVWVGVGR
jgi:hypothetical protein